MTIPNVDRALAMLEALAGDPEGMPLVALATRLDFPKSATHRLLEALVARGYVLQDSPSQRYRLSMKLGTLAFRMLDARGLPDVSQDVLDRLATDVGEYCRIAVVENGTLNWVARAQGASQGLRYAPPMGGEVALHATASGKAWLATLPDDDALAIALQRGLRPRPGMGPRAPRNLDELRRHLRDTRRRGFAMAVDEAEAGIAALATTFRGSAADGAPAAGTVSIAGPAVRLDARRAALLAPRLIEAGAELTELWPMRRHQASGGDIPRAA